MRIMATPLLILRLLVWICSFHNFLNMFLLSIKILMYLVHYFCSSWSWSTTISSCKVMRNSDSGTMQMLINLRKTPLDFTWCWETFICMNQRPPVFCSAEYGSTYMVFIAFLNNLKWFGKILFELWIVGSSVVK